jgi:bifunctional ADP-heptose synthase (sugar kinase/adenylyltransferase)
VRAAEKVMPRERIAGEIARLRAERGKVVFTNGVFDLLHVGHVR